jgi:hypothetical protein
MSSSTAETKRHDVVAVRDRLEDLQSTGMRLTGLMVEELNAERPLGDAFLDLDQSSIRDDARAVLQRNAEWILMHCQRFWEPGAISPF